MTAETPAPASPAMVEIRNRWTGAVIRTAPATPSGRADLTRADLTGADLTDADLTRADLTRVDLTDAVLTRADLRRADLTDADLTRAVLRRADLTDAVLRRAVLRRADLTDADLTRVDLTDAVLTGADLTDAVLTGAGSFGEVPTIPRIHSTVYAAASEPGALDMSAWHGCETTHCRAGWVVHLAGEKGAELEARVGVSAAAALIYYASDPSLKRVPNWYASNEAALDDMRRLAAMEKVA